MKLAVPILILAGTIAAAHTCGSAFAQTQAPASEPSSEPAPAAATESGAAEPAAPAPPDQPALSEPAAPPPAPVTATIRVTVDNVESDRGDVWVALCNASLSVEGCPYQKKVAASPGSTEVTFKAIPPGVYAVAGYDDLNGNGVFDKFMGMPREPYALSGAAAEKLIPSFDDAALPMQAGENRVTIRMKRLGG